ncbi:response regulator [Vampirovibrio chlorellavorus]|uniref:response regulator n=1 Tax=Vampirovibrio chlorellavorus TaxID=758823 RepID=UPI0026ECA1FD|nr:response regulator [Vampirovibrio chlorellavorus]
MSDFQVVLLVGNAPGQDMTALMGNFGHPGMLTLLHSERLGPGGETVQAILAEVMPDLICLFADDLEAQGDDVLGFCEQIREQGLKVRPIVVVQSDAQENQRIQYLLQGADDIFGPTLSEEEFQIRLLVHLRRNLDFAANAVTQLPGLQFAQKVVQRRLNQQKPVALLTVALDHFDVYSEAYGDLPARQVLKTVAAMLSRIVMVPDFISQSDENHFVIVSHPDKADKLAALACRQFETVSPNFYSEKDRKQGYLISVISDNISRRVPLLSLSIGIASTETQPFDSFMSLFNASQQMGSLARMQSGSSWQSDRLRLAGSIATPVIADRRPGILILETDAALAYLLKTTLEMEGFAVELVTNPVDAWQRLTENARLPGTRLVILDALVNQEETGLQLTSEIRAHYPEVRIICASSLHNRQRVLQAGADLYLPRPFELSRLFSWVHRLLTEN